MSITKDFEKRVKGVADEYTLEYMFELKDVVELLAHARALEAMLKKHEWSDNGFDDELDCKECGCSELIGHSPDCQLAELLEGVEDSNK